jgi:hypothetical protein
MQHSQFRKFPNQDSRNAKSSVLLSSLLHRGWIRQVLPKHFQFSHQTTLHQISESGSFLIHLDKNFKSHLRILCVKALLKDLQSFETFAIKKLQPSFLKIDIADSCEILVDIYQTVLCHVPEKIIKIIIV